MSETVSPPEPERAVDAGAAEASAVSAGWQLIEMFERLGDVSSKRLLQDWWADEAAQAREGLLPLEPWSGCGPSSVARYQSPSNSSRFHRMTAFMSAEDRIFDIGLGLGYQAATLVTQGRPAAYHGMDIDETNVRATKGALDANPVDETIHTVRQGDLFELTRADLERLDINFLICCEVLEHVREPERALRVLADALPEGAELLISVPLKGRLQRVWSHVTNFDAARLHTMLEDAGLHVHLVEPLHNVWSFVLASRSPAPSSRAGRAVSARPARPLAATASHRDFHFVDLTESTAQVIAPKGASVVVTKAKNGVLVTVTAEGGRSRLPLPGRGASVAAGIAFPVSGLHSARLELAIDSASGLTRLSAQGLRGDAECVSWSWDGASKAAGESPRVVMLDESKAGRHFVSTSRPSPSTATSMQVLAHLQPGGSVTFRLLRASYMP